MTPTRKPAIVGHRGTMGTEPENTVRSFRRAVAEGVDAIEIDLHRSADGELVICHDADVKRTTDGSGPIAELTLAELKRLDAGEGERMPTFDEVIDAVDGTSMQAEVKGAGVVPLLAERLRARDLVGQVMITSFHRDMLAEAQQIIPEASRALIFSGLPADAIDQALSVGATAICPGLAVINAKAVADCRAAGLQVYGWPVNDEAGFNLAMALGLDAITSDYPATLLAARASTGASASTHRP